MKKTCLLFVVGVCVASVAYFFLIRRYIPEIPLVPSIGLGILGGVSALALFGGISTFVQGISDRGVLNRALKNSPLVDGEKTAALGTINATGLATITAPFSGRDCIAYEYEVYELIVTRSSKGPSRTTKQLYCSGFGSIPSHIRTTQGQIRILGFPLIDAFPKDFMTTPEKRRRAEEYIQQTTFNNIKLNFNSVFSEFDDLFRDADGAVRKDLGEPVQIEDKHHLTEVIVPRKAEVCAIGVYSGREMGLFAKTSALPIRLIPGNVNEVKKQLKKTGTIVFALIFFLFINGILSAIFLSSQKQKYNIPESEQWSVIHDTAAARDFIKLTSLFENGVNPDATDSQSRTLLQTTRDPEVARFLLNSGANPNVEDPATLETPIFEAARTGDVQRLKVLIAGGATVNATTAIPWEHTPIDEAIRTGQSEAVRILLEAGAKDPRVTISNGKPLDATGGQEIAVCLQYLRAIQHQDKETLKSITTARYEYFFDDIDYQVWKPAYPHTIETFQGFTNDSAATVQLSGRRADANITEWIFQLVKHSDGWKIHQTWPQSGDGYEVLWR